MFRLAIVVCTLLAAGGARADTHQIGPLPMPDGRIVGGSNADIREYPHQISMRYKGRHRCGGSIYSANVIVSAAHCVFETDASLITIVAGSTLLSKKNVEIPVLKYIIHSSYKVFNNDYDVAILVLNGRLNFNQYIQPIALTRERPATGTEVTVTGWGTLVENGNSPDHLQQVNVNVVDNSNCRKSYLVLLTKRMLCAGVDGGGQDACQGDSGGPLIVNNQLLGIVSWGVGCAQKHFPGVYASVPDLADWIEATVAANTLEFVQT